MTEDDLKKRTKQFALRILKLVVQPLWTEADEIVAIMTSSRKSAAKALVAEKSKSKIKTQKSKI